MTATEILNAHRELGTRKIRSITKLEKLAERLSSSKHAASLNGTIFAAGSYGRLEAGDKSDLDVFVIGKEVGVPLGKIRVLSAIADINDELSLPPFDGEMRFFKVYSEEDLVDNLGKPKDDTENSFTARMLLLLESRAVLGEAQYDELIEKVVRNYFRDNKGKKDYRPLFMLNDLLRYWRTLCLNYEDTRGDPARKWRKKNLNLRFSRLCTVFSTVAVLLQSRPATAAQFLPYVKMTPFERLASSLDGANCSSMHKDYRDLLDNYEWFLELKDSKGQNMELEKELMNEARLRAEAVANFYHNLFRKSEFEALSKYLVI